MVFLSNLSVNLRACLCGLINYASAQALERLDLGQKSSFLDWIHQKVPFFGNGLLWTGTRNIDIKDVIAMLWIPIQYLGRLSSKLMDAQLEHLRQHINGDTDKPGSTDNSEIGDDLGKNSIWRIG